MERRRVRFSGRVQGVGFRATAQRMAAQFHVTGWVRNEPDGDVVLEVQGPADRVGPYLTALKRHMSGYVQRMDVTVVPLKEGEEGFEIR